MSGRERLVAVVAAALVGFAVVELLRRRRLHESFAIAWIAAATAVAVLAAWTGLRDALGDVIGLDGGATFVLVLAVALTLLLLQLATEVSRWAERTRSLAQRSAIDDASD